jgi:hypothetical protein
MANQQCVLYHYLGASPSAELVGSEWGGDSLVEGCKKIEKGLDKSINLCNNRLIAETSVAGC